MNIYTIGSDITEHWHWVQPYVDKVVGDHPSGYETPYYLESIKAGHVLVLVIEDAGKPLCVSLLACQPNALHVISAAGEGLDKWGHLAEQCLTEIATAMKVEYITSHARKGWAKLQTQHNGWTERESYIVRAV